MVVMASVSDMWNRSRTRDTADSSDLGVNADCGQKLDVRGFLSLLQKGGSGNADWCEINQTSLFNDLRRVLVLQVVEVCICNPSNYCSSA